MQLLPKPFHRDSQRIIVYIISIAVPYLIQQLSAGDGSSFIVHQHAENGVFLAAQRNFFPPAQNRLSVRNQRQIITDHSRFFRSLRPPQQRQDPGMQHFQFKGFGHIIVRAALKAGNDILYLGTDGQQQDREGRPSLPHPPAKRIPAAIRQVPVHQGSIRPLLQHRPLHLADADKQTHSAALLFQIFFYRLPNDGIILGIIDVDHVPHPSIGLF